jgi:hypothetical protein
MTTPKEKAEKLFNKFRKEFDWVESQYAIDLYRDTRQCALIAVDELIKFGNEQGIREPMMYWHKVKEELEKL